MLVLTRKQGEQIRIGDNVVVTVVRVKGQAIRWGIEAPQDVRVVRGELSVAQEEVSGGLTEPAKPAVEPARPEPSRASHRTCPDDERYRNPATTRQER